MISSKFHAVLDFILIILLLASPGLFHLTEQAGRLLYTLAGIHFVLSIVTDYAAGIFKLVPFRLHGLAELLLSMVLLILAFTVFDDNLRDEIYFACLGLFLLMIYSLTDYKKNQKVLI